MDMLVFWIIALPVGMFAVVLIFLIGYLVEEARWEAKQHGWGSVIDKICSRTTFAVFVFTALLSMGGALQYLGSMVFHYPTHWVGAIPLVVIPCLLLLIFFPGYRAAWGAFFDWILEV